MVETRQRDKQTERDADTEIKEERQKETKGCLHCSSRRTTNLNLGEKDVESLEADINRQLDRLSQKDRQITSYNVFYLPVHL